MSLAIVLPALHITQQHWLFAAVFAEGLLVYRSIAMKTTDKLYQPVQDYITKHTPSLLMCEHVDDEAMYFGSAEFAVYQPKDLLGGSIDR